MRSEKIPRNHQAHVCMLRLVAAGFSESAAQKLRLSHMSPVSERAKL